MKKIQKNRLLLGDLSKIKSADIPVDTLFDLPGKGLCRVASNFSSSGDKVSLFETEDGSSVFHYNIVDAIVENTGLFPLGEIFQPYSGSLSDKKFIVIAKRKDGFYFCKSIEEKAESLNQDSWYACFNLNVIKNSGKSIDNDNLINPLNIFDWINSHDPEYCWDFSDPENTTRYFVQVITESGGLNLKSLINLINVYNSPIPLLNEEHENDDSLYNKWFNWIDQS